MGRAVVSGAADPLTGVSGLAADAFSSYRPEVATAVCVRRAWDVTSSVFAAA
jgi:hypothetical protein